MTPNFSAQLNQDFPDPEAPAPDTWLALAEDAAAIVEKELPPPVEIIAGIVCEQSKLIIGSGAKSNKTWLTMDAALCIAYGKNFLDRATTRQRVLYVNLELKGKTFDRRLQVIARTKDIILEPGWFIHLPLRGQLAGQPVASIISRIITLALHYEVGVVVLDPLYKLNFEGDENAVQAQTLLLNTLDRITTEAKATLILCDHFSKGNQSEKDPLDAIRGSSAKGGDCDAAMILRRHEVEDCFRVDMIHRELPPVEPFCIGWNYPLMELRSDLAPDRMKKPGGRTPEHCPEKLLSAIKDSTGGNPVTISAWAESAGVPRKTLTDYLPGLRVKGWINTAGEGGRARQYVTDTGRQAIHKWERNGSR